MRPTASALHGCKYREHRVALEALAEAEIQRLNDAVSGGLEGHLKLHALDHDQRVTGTDRIAHRDRRGDHRSRHRRGDSVLCRAVGLRRMIRDEVTQEQFVWCAIELNKHPVSSERAHDGFTLITEHQRFLAFLPPLECDRPSGATEIELVASVVPSEPDSVERTVD